MSAAEWLTRSGYGVWIPLGHSPDIDLLAQREDRFLRVQVKTATVFTWFIPAAEVGGTTVLLLGGPKYARFEVDSLVGEAGFEPA